MSGAKALPTYDVFISYHSGDADWVGGLVKDLEARQIRVWVDGKKILPGDLFVKALEDALESVRCIVAVVSAGSHRSAWVREECNRALVLLHAAGDGERRLIPILIDDAEPGGFLANRSWVDFRDPAARAHSLKRLVAGINGAPPGTEVSDATLASWRDDSPSEPNRADIAPVEFLRRRIESARDDAKNFRRWRLLGLLTGFGISAVSWGVAPTRAPERLAAVVVAATLVPYFVAWGVTHFSLTTSMQKIRRFEVLRDGLQLCVSRTNPACRNLRERFWATVLAEHGPGPPGRGEVR